MSGTAPNTINLNILPIAQDLIPRAAEGSKGCSLQIYWQNIFNIVPTFPIVATINLLMQYNTGQFTTIQAVWIDNSTVPYPVTLTAVETQQSITVPAFFQGMYPIFASTAPVFTASLNIYPDPNYGMSIGACTTKFIFLNTPQRYFEKYSPIIAPFQYTNNLVLTSTTPVAMGALGPGGIGFAATGTPTNYFRFFAADFTINTLSAGTSAGSPNNVALRESGHSSVPFTRAIMEWVNSTSVGLVFGRELIFPDGGLLQMDPLNSWFLMFSGVGMPASGVVVTCNINGEAITIA